MAELARQVVPTDRFDAEDYANINQKITPIGATIDRLAEVNWTAERLVQDVFHSLNKPRPDITDRAGMEPSYRVNQAVMDEFTRQDAWEDLRQYTVGDEYMAGSATVSISRHIEEMLQRLTEAQEAADEAQEARDEFNEGRENGAGGDELRDLATAADQANNRANELIDDMAATISGAVREAATEAAEKAEGEATAAAGWGLDSAGMARMDPEERVALSARLTNDRMRKIAAMLGRLRNEAWAAETSRWENGNTDLHGITLGDDLSRLTASELVNLAVPELEVDFLDRYTRKELSVYELRQRAREAKGTVIYVEDSSSSMNGDREIWARAVGLSLLAIAKEQGRTFTAIVFASENQQWTVTLPPDHTVTDMLDYAEFQFMGGTHWETPLVMAAAMVADDVAATGHSGADVVFATDDACAVADEWVGTFNSEKARLGFRVFGLSILGTTESMAPFCDATFPIQSLVDGSDITSMFRTIQTPALTNA